MSPRWTEALLRLTLRGGSVYYLQDRSLTSPEPHYFVVLNLDPNGDHFLVMVVVSSNISGVHERFRNLPASTRVEISPADYNTFTKQSIVDCNHFFRATKLELLQKLQTGFAKEYPQLHTDILAKLRAGILASPLIEDEIKQMVQ